MNKLKIFYTLITSVLSLITSLTSYGAGVQNEFKTRHLAELKLVEPDSDECKHYDNSGPELIVKTDPNCIKLSYEIKIDTNYTPAVEYLVLHGSLVGEGFNSLKKTGEVYKLVDHIFYPDNLELKKFNFYIPTEDIASTFNGGIIPFQMKVDSSADSLQVALPEIHPNDSSFEVTPTFTVIEFKIKEEGQCNFKNKKKSSCIRKIKDLTIKRGVHLFLPQ